MRRAALFTLIASLVMASCATNSPQESAIEGAGGVPREPGEVRVFDGIEFVWIPPGEFMTGSSKTEEDWAWSSIDKSLGYRYSDFECEGPVHRVRISKGFWMGKCEVTQAQYRSVMGTVPKTEYEDAKRPVVNVSWPEAVLFCHKLSVRNKAVFRLPTEAEWEYACRAGTTTRYYWGDDSCLAVMGEYCWYWENSLETPDRTNNADSGCPPMRSTKPVGLKKPNGWGLHDMCGNVWELCTAPGLQSQDVSARTTDRSVPMPCVVRGGSYISNAEFCRSAALGVPTIPRGIIGFRVVREE